MAGRVLINDEGAVLDATGVIYTAAQAMSVPQNGSVLSFDEENRNYRARRLVRFANELRRKVGLPEQDPLAVPGAAPEHVG